MNLKNHKFLVLLCCLIPLAILAFIFVFGFNQSYFVFFMLLLCPLLHLFMMKDMHSKDGGSNNSKEVDAKDNKEGCH